MAGACPASLLPHPPLCRRTGSRPPNARPRFWRRLQPARDLAHGRPPQVRGGPARLEPRAPCAQQPAGAGRARGGARGGGQPREGARPPTAVVLLQLLFCCGGARWRSAARRWVLRQPCRRMAAQQRVRGQRCDACRRPSRLLLLYAAAGASSMQGPAPRANASLRPSASALSAAGAAAQRIQGGGPARERAREQWRGGGGGARRAALPAGAPHRPAWLPCLAMRVCCLAALPGHACLLPGWLAGWLAGGGSPCTARGGRSRLPAACQAEASADPAACCPSTHSIPSAQDLSREALLHLAPALAHAQLMQASPASPPLGLINSGPEPRGAAARAGRHPGWRDQGGWVESGRRGAAAEAGRRLSRRLPTVGGRVRTARRLRRRMPRGECRQPCCHRSVPAQTVREEVSVLAELPLLVREGDAPELYRAAAEDALELGPFVVRPGQPRRVRPCCRGGWAGSGAAAPRHRGRWPGAGALCGERCARAGGGCGQPACRAAVRPTGEARGGAGGRGCGACRRLPAHASSGRPAACAQGSGLALRGPISAVFRYPTVVIFCEVGAGGRCPGPRLRLAARAARLGGAHARSCARPPLTRAHARVSALPCRARASRRPRRWRRRPRTRAG